MSKTINITLPKGFKIEVQESKQLAPFEGILVLINDKNERLYVKLLPIEEIANKGLIFEVVTPKRLQSMGIEESYNELLWEKRKKGQSVTIEESASDMSEEEREAWERAKEKVRKEHGIGKPVTINIVGKGGSLGKSNEGEGSERELTDSEKQFLKREKIKEQIRELRQLRKEVEEEEALEKASNEGYNVQFGEKKGASGQAKLTPQQTGSGSGKSYNSYEEMIDDLRLHSHSQNPEEARNAQAILDELFRKTFQGRKEQPRTLEVEVPKTEKEKEERIKNYHYSPIKKLKELQKKEKERELNED